MTLLQNYILGNAYSIVYHVPLIEGTIYEKVIHEKTEARSQRIRVTPANIVRFFVFNLGKTLSSIFSSLLPPPPKKNPNHTKL